ncbi:class II glutamine amidotransferase, partial [Streptomyces sp. NPDC059556]
TGRPPDAPPGWARARSARRPPAPPRLGEQHGVPEPLQMTVAVSDGERVWAFRYSSQGKTRSLFYSSRAETVRHLHPELDYLREISDETRIVVSEPLGDLPGVWNELPEASYAIIPAGSAADHLPFSPIPP